MKKPKFTLSTEQMIKLNTDCCDVRDMLYVYGFPDFKIGDILLGLVSPKRLVKTWTNSNIMGSKKYLSKETQEIFAQYEEYKALKRKWKELQRATPQVLEDKF